MPPFESLGQTILCRTFTTFEFLQLSGVAAVLFIDDFRQVPNKRG